ncbi:alpha-glucuronidase family glycosyl hydrolase [Usitatibacter palustris]|uniref:Xylan alpha-1,2-glucuronidase n=1 Tax=Usitatibacter palustris TaxID=2732487 RepID=A0A6M4H931_9PROT|nr:alpha-glucuronidase family glycosyl hydrolase [Usitatibacter palustris]QJR15243.1 Extracellular xylan exo-alpha-(1->2)-glucuronosidase [Usitatibacter palustris]
MLALPLNPAWGFEEEGYDLWLRYRPLEGPPREKVEARAKAIVVPKNPSLTILAAVAELHRGLSGLVGRAPVLAGEVEEGAVVLATPASMPAIKSLKLPLAGLGAEGYLVRATKLDGHKVTLIAANSDVGLLYGTFAWLRAVRTGANLEKLDEQSAPKVHLRMLNHWDNLDRTVERGYAGESIWDWWTLPEVKDQRYVDYARATASLGINGTVLNNVNARIEIVTAPWIAKVKAVAEVLRPYGIKVYLAVRWSTPVELGDLKTADPLDPKVLAWWKERAEAIYAAIPDFGGFLVKANSEGQPGPQDYERSHADGANMLAKALAPHGGLVLWRAFVYSAHDTEDRHKQAYTEFKALDGKFAKNVIVQVKNGAIDFQPREPFHPLFGAVPKTPLFMEFQITKEYLGFATHLAYLGPMYEEVLQDDTHQGGKGTTVAKVIDGRAHGYKITGVAAVANTGSHRTWCGSHFDQANWYAFGRMAWDPEASSEAIAREWIEQTFSTDPRVVKAILAIMMESREAVVDYMTPLGLHHVMATGHHYGPGPWVSNLKRPEWNPVYYHQADKNGIGFDRTASGSNAASQYAPALAKRFSDPKTTPEKYLLWFHHLPWDYKMPSGRTLWEELIKRYDRGVDAVTGFRARWDKLKDDIDVRRHREVATFLAIQEREAQWWRDASIAYFASVSKRPLPKGTIPPPLSLDEYKSLSFPYAPGRGLPPRPYY